MFEKTFLCIKNHFFSSEKESQRNTLKYSFVSFLSFGTAVKVRFRKCTIVISMKTSKYYFVDFAVINLTFLNLSFYIFFKHQK